MKNDYVLKHNYGYGEEIEREELSKLELRNVVDLSVYIKDLISVIFNAKVKNNYIQFLSTNSIFEVLVEKI